MTWVLYNIPPTAARLPGGREATPKHFLKWIPLVVQYEIHYANAVPVPEMVV
jgi:hypothetical protein